MRHSFGKENREAEGLKVPYAKLVQECFSYTEQSEKKFRSLRVLTEAAFQILFGGSVLSLSFSRKASLLLYCPSICRRVLGKKLHPASFSFFTH